MVCLMATRLRCSPAIGIVSSQTRLGCSSKRMFNGDHPPMSNVRFYARDKRTKAFIESVEGQMIHRLLDMTSVRHFSSQSAMRHRR